MIRGIKGGQAIPLGKGFYYMRGRKHSQGGIDVSKNLEVEDKEIVQITPKHIKVYSAQPILNGISPAKAILSGANPNKVFNAQENYKDRNNLNDDGSKKATMGISKDIVDVNDNVVATSDLARMKRKQRAIESKESVTADTKAMVKTIAENTPIIGDMMTIKEATDAWKKGNILEAGIIGASMLLPFGVGKLIKKAKLAKAINATKNIPTPNIDTKSKNLVIRNPKENPVTTDIAKTTRERTNEFTKDRFRQQNIKEGVPTTKEQEQILDNRTKDVFVVNDNYTSSYNPENNRLTISEHQYNDRVYGHENKHKTDYLLSKTITEDQDDARRTAYRKLRQPSSNIERANHESIIYSPEEQQLLDDAYKFSDEYLDSPHLNKRGEIQYNNDGSIVKKKDNISIISEKAVTNNDTREELRDAFDYIYRNNERYNQLSNIEKYEAAINNASNSGILKALYNSNGYGEDFYNRFVRYAEANGLDVDADDYTLLSNGTFENPIFDPFIQRIKESLNRVHVGIPIGIAGATIVNNQTNKKAMGGTIERSFFTGGRKQSKRKAELGTEEQVQQQRKTRRRVNETNALGFNVEHPEAEILPDVEMTANVVEPNSVTLPSGRQFYGTEWNFSTTPQSTLKNGVYTRNSIPETNTNTTYKFTDWERAGRYPFGKYRPPFRRYNSIRPVGINNNSNSSFFVNDGRNLGVTYPILSLNGYIPTFDYTTKSTDNTPSIRTGMIPFRPFNEVLPEIETTDSDQLPVKKSSVSQTTVRPTSASVKPTKPTRRSVSPVTTIESYVDRVTNDFRLPSGPDVGIATKITNKDVSPVAKPKAESLTTDIKRRATNNSSVIQNTSSNFFKDNSSSLIGAASDLLSTGLSYMSNRNAIRNMSAPKAPVITPVRKLKTNYNINPQVDNIRETTNTLANEIVNNSSSSASVLNRINKLRLSGLMQKNQLYGQKQNVETQLINQDALNQQQVAATNVAAYNQYQDRLIDYNNKIADLKGENNIGLISGINSVIQNSLKNKKLEEQFIANLVATGLPYKDVVNFVTKRIPLPKRYKLQMQE